MAEFICPFCASSIPSEAMVCKFCRNIVRMPDTPASRPIPSQKNMKQDIASLSIYFLLIATNIVVYCQFGNIDFVREGIYFSLAALAIGSFTAYLVPNPNFLILFLAGSMQLIVGAIIHSHNEGFSYLALLDVLYPSIIFTTLLTLPSILCTIVKKEPFSFQMISVAPIRNWVLNDTNLVDVMGKGILKVSALVTVIISIKNWK